jgi:hypothetical protein
MALKEWVRLPSRWIDAGGLTDLPWRHGGGGADNIAALMALTVIAHAADSDTGVANVTYDHTCDVTGLSRAKLSKGLEVLTQLKIVRPSKHARSTYKLVNYDPSRSWAKLPAKSMYASGRIAAFDEFRLRKVVELDALKLFFLFAARRDRSSNVANIGYEKIEEYTDIRRVRIKPAISFLASLSLVYVEHIPSRINVTGISNAYRLVGLDSYNHMGTRGRSMEALNPDAL